MSTIDYAKARELMVEQQIRPWDVFDPRVLAVLAELPREDFVPAAHRTLAYADIALPLGHGEAMGWYDGPALLEHLETVAAASRQPLDEPFRMAVQWVSRPNQNFRGYAGRIASGPSECPAMRSATSSAVSTSRSISASAMRRSVS